MLRRWLRCPIFLFTLKATGYPYFAMMHKRCGFPTLAKFIPYHSVVSFFSACGGPGLELNRHPAPYEDAALPFELQDHVPDFKVSSIDAMCMRLGVAS